MPGRLTEPAPALDGAMRLLVDYEPQHLDQADATKVPIEGNHITDIGKALRPYHAIDAGYFLLDRRVFGALHAVQREEPPSVSAGMLGLAQAGELARTPRLTHHSTARDRAVFCGDTLSEATP